MGQPGDLTQVIKGIIDLCISFIVNLFRLSVDYKINDTTVHIPVVALLMGLALMVYIIRGVWAILTANKTLVEINIPIFNDEEGEK